MKLLVIAAAAIAGAATTSVVQVEKVEPQTSILTGEIHALTVESEELLLNPLIDMEAYLISGAEMAKHRESHRVTEENFIRMALDSDTIILDTRSRAAWELMHVKGSVNLPFSDIAQETLDTLFPDKEQNILIYCNNNFQTPNLAFTSKLAPTSLNLSTYHTLYDYGYRNVYELQDFLAVKDMKLELVGQAIDDPSLLDQGVEYFIARDPEVAELN